MADLINSIPSSISKEDIKKSGFEIVAKIKKLYPDFDNTDDLKFVDSFFKGYNNRPSKRISKKPGTVPDKIIDHIIQSRITQFTYKEINLIRFGHKLSMSAENIVGLILEEYIHNKVIQYQWSCCWANSIKAADFCSNNGDLLQVKNRSNTENSSSSKIRLNTPIKKWYRIDAPTGATKWHELNSIIGIPDLMSEEDFIQFTCTLIKENPSALYVAEDEIQDSFSIYK